MSAVFAPTIASRFEIVPFAAPLGAEVTGLDLASAPGDEEFARIHRAHLDHHVLVFRNQCITPAQQVAFSRRFAALQIHVLRQFQLATEPEILIISNVKEDGQPIGLGDAGHFWYSDLSYKERPSLGSMLHAQELPQEGGDTLFAHSVRSEHVYRHRWQPHDMVFWDNRSLMHLAAGCPEDQRRKLYRTTIEGDVPF